MFNEDNTPREYLESGDGACIMYHAVAKRDDLNINERIESVTLGNLRPGYGCDPHIARYIAMIDGREIGTVHWHDGDRRNGWELHTAEPPLRFADTLDAIKVECIHYADSQGWFEPTVEATTATNKARGVSTVPPTLPTVSKQPKCVDGTWRGHDWQDIGEVKDENGLAIEHDECTRCYAVRISTHDPQRGWTRRRYADIETRKAHDSEINGD